MSAEKVLQIEYDVALFDRFMLLEWGDGEWELWQSITDLPRSTNLTLSMRNKLLAGSWTLNATHRKLMEDYCAQHSS